MILYSQRDIQYSAIPLGISTIKKDGCVVMSLSTLFQKTPREILSVPHAFNWKGECDIQKVVEYFGGKITYRGIKKPSGWCLAKTSYYKNAGQPTHYFPYNPDTKEAIDPLQNPAARMQNIYPINEYIWIEGIKLDLTKEDLEKRIKIAQNALDSGRLSRFRAFPVVNFIKRATALLSKLFPI